PADRASLLDGLELPDRERYERLHRVQAALLRHDRPAAAEVHAAMLREDPGNRITRYARLALARHDANPPLVLSAIEDLRAMFPEAATLLLAKVGALRDLGRKEERFALAEEQIHSHEADPLFAQHFAQMLMPDPSRHGEGVRVLDRALRRRP